MTAHVISHPRLHRKRRLAPRGRRLGVLAVTLAALAAASWLASLAIRAPRPAPIQLIEVEPAEPLAPVVTEELAPLDLGQPRQRASRRASGVPLDADPGSLGEDYEILTVAELDAISQAREGDGAPQFAALDQAATTPAEADMHARELSDGQDQGGQPRRRTRRR